MFETYGKHFHKENFDSIDQSLQSLTEAGELTLSMEDFRANFYVIIPLLVDYSEEAFDEIQINERPVSAHWIRSLARDLREYEDVLKKEAATTNTEAEGWATSLLHSVSRYLPESFSDFHMRIHWFQIGSFERPDLWVVDKTQIKAILEQEARDKYLFLCPSFRFREVEGIVDRLPDSIDISKNQNWSVYQQPRLEGTHIRTGPVGIIHKITQKKSSSNTKEKQDSEKRPQRNIPKVSFGQIGGIDRILGTIREVIELPLKKPELFEHLGITPHKGVLLYGPPGCGKTMIAKAIAHEVQAHFISVKGPEILNKYYGQSEENLRNLFEEAAEYQPSIIFFDEIDALAQSRSGLDSGRMDNRLVNQLLTLMDGVEDFGKVTLLAATNRIELIDSALLRPGRFDYKLEVPLPDEDGVKDIFDVTIKDMPFKEKGKLLDSIYPQLHGFSGADISYVARESAYNCLRRILNLEEQINPEIFVDVNLEKVQIELGDVDKAISELKEKKK
jgi:ATP-dependent 26S proteasome regulatory subunit